MSDPVTSLELERLERLFLKWPCSPRLKRRIAEERAKLVREKEARARALRGQVRRSLMAADADTLVRVLQEMEVNRAS